VLVENQAAPEAALGQTKRPLLLTVLCILSALGALVVIPAVFSPSIRRVAIWYPEYLAFSTVIGLICTFGIWKMKKWAVILYTVMFFVAQVILISIGAWKIYGALIPMTYAGACYAYYSRMK
jgi:hypothetical protein